MFDPLISLLPIYALLALGALAIRVKLISPEGLPHLSRFVLVICMPVIVASAVMRAGDLSAFNWWFIGGYAFAALIVLGIGSFVMVRVFGLKGPLGAMMAMGMCSSNTIFLGYPIGRVLFPEQADALFAWIITAENLVVIPAAIVLSEALSGEKGQGIAASLRQTLGQMVRSPVLIGLVAGLLIAGFGIPITGPVETTRGMIAAATPVLSLVFVGGTVATAQWREGGAAVMAVALGKLLVHPLVTVAVLLMIPGVSQEIALAGLVFAAMPMIAIFPILAARHGGAAMASSAMLLTTLLGAITVSAVAVLIP
ncbi:AEC family transporter [Pacificoceanicola onchidii]|uniref:AEC family transporter n=1 Tax=Pacificoceanicola onchidii TaxID=2562685 RepID=UPI0010A6845E|nr:AEC family transporter [Pacificoceanicola onchidii]